MAPSHYWTWLCFYQTRSAWSMDQGSTKKHSAVHNFVPTVTKFCVMWEGLSLPHDTKFGNCRGEIVDRRTVFIWSLIHGSGWSRLIKAEPVLSYCWFNLRNNFSKSLNQNTIFVTKQIVFENVIYKMSFSVLGVIRWHKSGSVLA